MIPLVITIHFKKQDITNVDEMPTAPPQLQFILFEGSLSGITFFYLIKSDT